MKYLPYYSTIIEHNKIMHELKKALVVSSLFYLRLRIQREKSQLFKGKLYK